MRVYWFSAHWHFSTLLHIKLPGAQSRMPTVNREWDWSFYWDVHPATLAFWVCSMLRMGKVMVGRLDCASIPAWKAPPPRPSTQTSGSAAEHVSRSGPGFSFLLKDTWEGRADVYWYSKHVVLVLVLLPREEGGSRFCPGGRPTAQPSVRDVIAFFPFCMALKKVHRDFFPLPFGPFFSLQCKGKCKEIEPLTLSGLQLVKLHIRVNWRKRWPFTHDLSYHAQSLVSWLADFIDGRKTRRQCWQPWR